VRRAGFSAVEALTSLAISVLVIGGAATLYAFSLKRAVLDSARASLLAQVHTAGGDMARVISNATHCDAFAITGSSSPFNGASALRCAMPENWVDTGGSAAADSYLASRVGVRGAELSVANRWIWHIWLPAGYGGDSGKRLLRTTTTSPLESSLNPGSPSAWDPSFTMAGSARWRFDRITSAAWKVDSDLRTVEISLRAQSVGRQAGAPVTEGDRRSSGEVTLVRTLSWSNGLDPSEIGDGPNLAAGGFFEAGTIAGWTASGGAYSVTRWLHGGQSAPFYHLNCNGGNAPGAMVLSQSVALESGATYVLSFSSGMYSASSALSQNKTMRARITLTGNTGVCLGQWEVSDQSSSSTSVGAFAPQSLAFRATASTSATLEIRDLTTSADTVSCDLLLGRFQLRRALD
jgi:hypothetical protein